MRAVEALRKVLEGGRPAAPLVGELARGLSPPDADLLRELALGTLRWKAALDAEIAAACRIPMGKLAPNLREILEVALYQLRHLDRIPPYAAVSEAVTMPAPAEARAPRSWSTAFCAGFSFCRVRSSRRPGRSAEALAVLFASRLSRRALDRPLRTGRDAGHAGRRQRASALDLLVNPRRTTREGLVAALATEGVETEPSALTPLGLTVVAGNPLRSTASRGRTLQRSGPGRAGAASPAASGRVARGPGRRAGRKSLSALAHGRARWTVALDVRAADCGGSPRTRAGWISRRRRSPRISGPCRFRRGGSTGCSSTRPAAGPGRSARIPRSATASRRRRSSAWPARQERWLAAAAALLAPGGWLLYATCSLEQEENERVVERVCARVEGLSPTPIEPPSVWPLRPGRPPAASAGRPRRWVHRAPLATRRPDVRARGTVNCSCACSLRRCSSVGRFGSRAATAARKPVRPPSASVSASNAWRVVVVIAGESDPAVAKQVAALGANALATITPPRLETALAAESAGLAYLPRFSTREIDRLPREAARVESIRGMPAIAGFQYIDEDVEEGYASPETQARAYGILKALFPGRLALYATRLDLIATDAGFLPGFYRPEFTDLVVPYFYPVGTTVLGVQEESDPWESGLRSLLEPLAAATPGGQADPAGPAGVRADRPSRRRRAPAPPAPSLRRALAREPERRRVLVGRPAERAVSRNLGPSASGARRTGALRRGPVPAVAVQALSALAGRIPAVTSPARPIPILDLTRYDEDLKRDIAAGVEGLFSSGRFILVPVNAEFEKAFAERVGVRHALGVSSGTDALLVALMALGVGPGDEVVTSPFSFFASAGVVARLGATAGLRRTSSRTPSTWTRTAFRPPSRRARRSSFPCTSTGRAATWTRSGRSPGGIPVVEDACQAVGATHRGRPVGSLGTTRRRSLSIRRRTWAPRATPGP